MSKTTKTIVDGNVTTEIIEMSGDMGDLSTEEILAKMGGKAGTFFEVREDGTKVTYEVDMEEFEVSKKNL